VARKKTPAKKTGGFRLFVIVCGLLIVLVALQRKHAEESKLQRMIDASMQALYVDDLFLTDDDLNLEILATPRAYRTSRQIEQMLRSTGDQSGLYSFYDSTKVPYTLSAQGIDSRQHLVNIFLEGYEPFRVDNLALPLYVIARRKTYQVDATQYPGQPDVWQSSRQSFFYPQGDCEDHAVLLADWLISMGEDARVTIGDWNGSGHAWVVLFKNGREYLLEATQKRGVSRNTSYPLAVLFTQYTPEYMFNREYFWTNTGSKFTTSYSGKNWQKRSRLNYPSRQVPDRL